jgi:hypothetical protein
MVLSLSVSAVKCRLECKVLKAVRMDWMSVSLGSEIRSISSTYRN